MDSKGKKLFSVISVINTTIIFRISLYSLASAIQANKIFDQYPFSEDIKSALLFCPLFELTFSESFRLDYDKRNIYNIKIKEFLNNATEELVGFTPPHINELWNNIKHRFEYSYTCKFEREFTSCPNVYKRESLISRELLKLEHDLFTPMPISDDTDKQNVLWHTNKTFDTI